MEATFWKKRWEQNHIGFHMQEVNSQLEKFLGYVRDPSRTSCPCSSVRQKFGFTLACTKTVRVDGVELSEIAVNAFLKKITSTAKHQHHDDFEHFSSGNINLYLGDFFRAPKLREHYQIAYDNLGLCALSEDYRERYADVLADMVELGGKVLINVVEHQPEATQEPPFSVSEFAMRHLFERNFQVNVLDRVHRSNGHPQVKDGKLSYFDDVTYLLTRRNPS